MNRSQMTSISFTVDDDLITESSLNSTVKSRQMNNLNPFSKQYGIAPVSNQKLKKKIQQQAQNDAYKELNDGLFNPFQHKLGNNFVPGQDRFYEQQKRRQLEMLKKKQEDMVNNNRNYTIVFNNKVNNQQKKDVLQTAGKNLVNADDSSVPSISDYYKKKFMKKNNQVPVIQEQDEDKKQSAKKIVNNQNDKKVDNFINSAKKNEKKMLTPKKSIQSNKNIQNSNRVQNNQKIKSQNTINIQQKKSIQKNKSRHQLSSQQDSLDHLDRLMNNHKPQKKATIPKTPVKKPPTPQSNKPIVYKNLEPQEVKKQLKKQLPRRKPQVPKAPKNNNNAKVKNVPAALKGKKKYADVYEGSDRNLVQQLESELTECPTITFDDIAQLQTAKNLLQQAVILPRIMPEFFQGIRKPTKGILLFGPPGTGKTLLAKAIAHQNVFLNVSAASLASKWKGDSQKMVRILFEIASHYAPSVIFFDQIDAIGSKRSSNQHQSNRKVKTELLVQMDGVGDKNNNVVVLAASNRPWDLDEALRRRLQKRIYIPLPEKQGRKKMFQINLKSLKISEKVNWQKLAQITKGYSGADICNLCRDAAYMPMRRKLQQVGGIQKIQALKQSQLTDQQIRQSDLMQATKRVKPSVGKEDLKRYQAWMAQFGSS